MKKKLTVLCSILVIVAMAIALTACGGGNSGDDTPAPAGSGAASGGAKTLSMATNAAFPPYEYMEGNEYVGIDIEIAQAIADSIGAELVINDVEFGSIIGGVQSGKYDMGIAGMTVTEERLQSVNFSDTYATGVQVIIVKEGSAIASVGDLANAKIGVQMDTTGDIYCCGDFGEDHVTEFKTGADAVQALLTDKVDCVVIDNEPAKSFVAANEGLKILETAYTVEDYAICVAKDNEDLLNTINAALKDLKASGKLDEIISKYIN